MTEQIRLSDRASREMREQQEADDRVWILMDLICAEWKSDPMAVQCFDERIVREAINLVAKRKRMNDLFNPFKPMSESGGNMAESFQHAGNQPET